MTSAEDRGQTCSANSVYSPGSSSPMGSKCRFVIDRLWGFATSCKKSSTPRARRISHRDVEKEEFQYASTQCLSSYYSVFVVRLAIMVSEFAQMGIILLSIVVIMGLI